MKGKKTVGVNGMLDWANKQLQRTDEFADEKFKAGICSMIERMLYDTNQYNGYTPLNDANVGEVGYYNRFYHMKS